jgi:hypothetical protein
VPTFHNVRCNPFPKGDPCWRLYLYGPLFGFRLPDPRFWGGWPPGGLMYWHVQSDLVPQLSFDEFTYR